MASESDQWLQAAAALKNYVQAGDSSAYQSIAKTTVILDLTHSNLVQRHIEVRFDKHQTLDDLRHTIYQKTGTPHTAQHLQLYNAQQQLLVEIPPTEDATIKLGYYSLAQVGMRVHCMDLNPHSISSGGQLEDTSLVQKYKMSDEDYAKRKNTLRRWEQDQQADDPTFTLAKHGQEHRELVEAKRLYRAGQSLPKGFEVTTTESGAKMVIKSKKEPEEDIGIESVANIVVDQRCEVQPGGRRGTVKYVGEVPELTKKHQVGDNDGGGYWVGICFDEPVGKSDGTVGGTHYFDAMPKFGGFCRGKNVQVGDFPERDIFDELEDDSDDDDEL